MEEKYVGLDVTVSANNSDHGFAIGQVVRLVEIFNTNPEVPIYWKAKSGEDVWYLGEDDFTLKGE